MVGLAMSLVLFACSDKGDTLVAAIENSSWRLQQIEIIGSQTLVIPPSEIYTMEFRTSSEVSGLNHCNTYAAKYTLASDGLISFRDMISTEIHCRPPTHYGEFHLALGKANSLRLSGDELRIWYSERARILHFIRN
jgi:heat shock protein HslJ